MRKIKECLHCKKELKGNQSKYCSKNCGNLFEYHNSRKLKVCPTCGKESSTKFCSQECYRIYKKKTKLVKFCTVCGKTYTTFQQKSKFCSNQCLRKDNYNKHKKSVTHKNCYRCGKIFEYSLGNRFCSIICRDIGLNTKVGWCQVCGKIIKEPKGNQICCSRSCYRNLPRIKERNKAYANSEKGREVTRKATKKYHKTESFRIYKKTYKAVREERVKQATPSCIKPRHFREIIKGRPEGQEIDHIIPLNHPNVCGLNVPWNMQYLSIDDNNLKSNQFDGTMENESWRKRR
jgi:predicted nucleic acid-binding Zn ribbon protein